MRPNTGFVFSCTTTANDGIKIRDSSNAGKQLYVNVCHHDAIEKPKDCKGVVVTKNINTTPGMEIPLVVGSLRHIEDNSALAVDVIVHGSIVGVCLNDRKFKRDVSQLALESVSIETTVQAKDIVTIDKLVYKGGRGEDGATPILLPLKIGTDGSVTTHRCQETSNHLKKENTLNNPINLLNLKKKEAEVSSRGVSISKEDSLASISIGSNSASSSSSKVLVTELVDTGISPSSKEQVRVINTIGSEIQIFTSFSMDNKLLTISVSGILSHQVPNLDLYASDSRSLSLTLSSLSLPLSHTHTHSQYHSPF